MNSNKTIKWESWKNPASISAQEVKEWVTNHAQKLQMNLGARWPHSTTTVYTTYSGDKMIVSFMDSDGNIDTFECDIVRWGRNY